MDKELLKEMFEDFLRALGTSLNQLKDYQVSYLEREFEKELNYDY